jgi:hypothetical protein
MNKLFELFPGVKVGVARVSPIRASVPATTNHTGGSMKKFSAFLLCAAFAVSPAFAKHNPPPPPGLQPVNLASVATFAVFSNAAVTSTGNTVINGDLGVYPGTSVTGLKESVDSDTDADSGPGLVNGTIQDNDTSPETTAAENAAASFLIAYKDAQGRTGAHTAVCPGTSLANLGGATLTPGLYRSGTTLALTGTLTLHGAGVYIFQIGSGLTVNDSAQVILSDGAKAANIFWQVGTAATFGTAAAFEGTILAGSGITMGSSTTLVGRALAKTAVTFITDTVTRP